MTAHQTLMDLVSKGYRIDLYSEDGFIQVKTYRPDVLMEKTVMMPPTLISGRMVEEFAESMLIDMYEEMEDEFNDYIRKYGRDGLGACDSRDAKSDEFVE